MHSIHCGFVTNLPGQNGTAHVVATPEDGVDLSLQEFFLFLFDKKNWSSE